MIQQASHHTDAGASVNPGLFADADHDGDDVFDAEAAQVGSSLFQSMAVTLEALAIRGPAL